MNIKEAVARACQEPTLVDALTWICLWESERIVQQARKYQTWDTCFKVCIREVLDSYEKLHNDTMESTTISKGYLDVVFEAAQKCTGEIMPDIWELRGSLHINGKCKNCKNVGA